MQINYVCEYRFDEKRKFKFDIALPELKIAIEYEGIVSAKSRHTSKTGYSKDCEKYNLATVQGWKVLRYTALNYTNLYQDIHSIINNQSK
jgi:very-short-patch-repair endonuclease